MERRNKNATPGLNIDQITDHAVATVNETNLHIQRSKWNRNLLVGGLAIGSLAGVISGVHNVGASEVVEKTAKGAEATVTSIDYKFSRQEVIGFTAEADGASASDVIKRTGPFGVPLPDIEAGMRVDDYGVVGALCFDSKSKKIEETTYSNSDKRHLKVEIDPADIRVCTKQDMSIQALMTPTGNIIEFINNASDDINRALGVNGDSVQKENAKKSELVQDAQRMALYTINSKCGPLVFEAAKDEMKQLIADDLRRTENETVEVVFKVGSKGEVAITGQSDLDVQIKKMQEQGRKLDAGSIGECKLPQSVIRGEDERPKSN